MTIRQTLALWLKFLWLGLLLVGALAAAWRDVGYNHLFRIVVLCGLFLSVALLFALGFRCPRCRNSFVLDAPRIISQRRLCCRNCGVSVDEKR
jgi:hypothetical protein